MGLCLQAFDSRTFFGISHEQAPCGQGQTTHLREERCRASQRITQGIQLASKSEGSENVASLGAVSHPLVHALTRAEI